MKSMRIAFISTMAAIPWGGSEVLWSETALRLKANGHDVVASVHPWPTLPEPLQTLENSGIVIKQRAWRAPSLGMRLLRKLKLAAMKSNDAEHFASFIAGYKPDLVCISQGEIWCGLQWMELCLQTGTPYVVVSHMNSIHVWPDDSSYLKVKRAHEGARKTFFVSEGNRRLFERQTCADLSNSAIVRNPFLVPFDSPPAWPSETNGLQLACVGRLDPLSKGQDLLIDIMAQEKWRNRPLEISFFGSGSYAESFQKLVQHMGLEDKIHFRGQVSDVVSIWASHHALVLPSRFEGLPIAVVEALLCNRLCIVTDVAGNAELLEDGRTGFVADAPTALHLDKALERAWERRADWQKIGADAGQHARSQLPKDPANVFADTLLATCHS